MNSRSSGGRLEKFFAGKGFYIVLFLCAAVIGLSAWMMASGKETMEDVTHVNNTVLDNKRVETVVRPPETAGSKMQSVMAETEPASTESESVFSETENTVELPQYVWPVQGELERMHDLENLSYDVTMHDWRTHEGIDISAALGAEVVASRSGVVESIAEDDFYGTVLTVSHGDGSSSVYANLASLPAVSVGQWVEAGQLIGTVGSTAICEIGQGNHLHFVMRMDGVSVDPLNYLPA